MVERGVVAAGHPLTARAGAEMLRAGGNAVDAAVAAMLTSFVAEPLLTGLGGGGYLLVVPPDRAPVLLDFFVEAPGRGADPAGRAPLLPVEVSFGDTVQVFHAGAASCGVFGVPAGVVAAAQRFGTVPLTELAAPAAGLARRGVAVNREQAYVFSILVGILSATPQARARYLLDGQPPREGDLLRDPDLADALDRLGAEGAAPFYTGDVGTAVADWVGGCGGMLTRQDLAAYRVVEREPLRVAYHGREVHTNPPPSAGGLLLAYSLRVLAGAAGAPGAFGTFGVPSTPGAFTPGASGTSGGSGTSGACGTPGGAGTPGAFGTPGGSGALGTDGISGADGTGGPPDEVALVRAMLAAQRAGTPGFFAGLATPGFAAGFLAGRLGSTTHISVLDADGWACAVTCSNGEGSGLVVPGTGVHVNNMMGEEDLSPLGFFSHPPGARLPSMMAPTAVLRQGVAEVVLGSAGSSRIRSALLQVIVNTIDRGMAAQPAVDAPRLHAQDGHVYAEPGVAVATLHAAGYPITAFRTRNLFFGGCQTVHRDPDTGRLSGGGDPRRGGAAVVA